MGIWSIKPQEIRAGSFTVRFGAHDDNSGACYMQITGATEGHQIMFGRDGEVLSIKALAAPGSADGYPVDDGTPKATDDHPVTDEPGSLTTEPEPAKVPLP